MKEFLNQHRKLMIVSIVLLLGIIIGGESIIAYLDNHTYYFGDERREGFFSDRANITLVILSLILAGIPLLYIFISNKFSLKKMIGIFGIISGFFGTIHCFIKGDIIGMGGTIAFFNTVLLFAIGIYSMIGFLSIGDLIARNFIKFKQRRWQEIMLSFGIGLSFFLLIINILLQLDMLYGRVSVSIFIGLGIAILGTKDLLLEDEKILNQEFIKIKTLPTSLKVSISLLIGIVLAYLLFGFQNSFIPYSTAWDANHEYMYIPKILSENAGVLWGNSVGGNVPGLWHGFITFFFSLAGGKGLPWHQILGLNPNTIAVSTNFRSAILVFMFGIGIVSEITNIIKKGKQDNINEDKEEEKAEMKQRICPSCKKVNKGNFCGRCGEYAPTQIQKIKEKGTEGIIAGRGVILLWLTSGMGAFLVMVDNKTDLGVMALSSLALFSGILFLENTQNETTDKKEYLKYLIIAGILFGCGCLAKVTAFVDLALFGILFIGLRLSNISALGLGFFLAGLVRILNILTASFIIDETTAKAFIVIGIILIIGGILNAWKDKKEIGTIIFQGIMLLLCFGISFLLFKTPGVIRKLKLSNTLSGETFKRTMLSQKDEENFDTSKALASTESIITKNPIVKASQDAKTCINQGNIYSEEELQENLEKDKGSGLNEDFGRYIGYGRKEFSKQRNITYPLIKLFFITDGCYGINTVAKKLCENEKAVDQFEIKKLKEIYQEVKDKNSEGTVLLKTAIEAFDAKYHSDTSYYNPQEFRDHIVALRQYYQSHSIKSEENYLAVPYRFLIPLNISMNRSLQNESSYYTDIGYIWIIIFLLMIGALGYAIIIDEKKLFSIALTNIIGRGIRWIIGSGILWYGTVLISRTAITLTMFFSLLQKRNHTTTIKNLIHLMIILCALATIFQICLNFVRIASQGASGPFVWYKENVGKEYYYDNNAQGKEKKKYGYGEKDIFNLQFPQYNALINYLKNRKDDDGVTVAGTYIQYFLDNQKNLKMDGMLTNFAEITSDGDLCKSYRRLKNQKVKYLIIDPNIGSVGMGEGNESLFHRFFAKINAVTKTIEKDGTISTIVKMYKQGYLKLISTNHIGIYYALNLSDQELKEYIGEMTDEELILKRAKLMGMRYFSEELDILFTQIYKIFYNRIISLKAIPEMLSILGVEGNEKILNERLIQYIQTQQLNITGLSKEETSTLIQYINIYEGIQTNNNQIGTIIQNLLINSISSSSQIMGVELL